MNGPTDTSSVSIVIATFNAADDLADARLRWSVPSERAEIVVQDGASTDNTLELLERLHSDGIVTSLRSNPDTGVYDAWNAALARCTGDWILFYGASDSIPLDWINTLAEIDADETDVVVGDLSIIGPGGDVLAIENRWMPASKSELFNYTLLPHVGMAHSKRLFASRCFDQSFKIAGDRDLLLDAWPFRVRRVDGVCQGTMVLGGLSNSPQMLRVANQEDRRMQRKHDVVMTWPRFLKGQAKNVISKFPWLWQASQSFALRTRPGMRG